MPFPSPRKILAAIVGIIAIVVVVELVSGFREAWRKMVRLDCQTNLKLIGLRCREYAEAHNGHFPSTWFELNLVGEDVNWAKLLHCPSTGHEVGAWTQVDQWADYRLFPGRTTNNPPNTILALEPLANHNSAGANVLFVDGGTQWWPAARVQGAAVGIVTNAPK